MKLPWRIYQQMLRISICSFNSHYLNFFDQRRFFSNFDYGIMNENAEIKLNLFIITTSSWLLVFVNSFTSTRLFRRQHHLIFNFWYTISLQANSSLLLAWKISLKITQLEKVHFIKVNELKLTQVELF